MNAKSGRRVSAKEAAEILGVPAHSISRLDARGEWIKRYKLSHKTHVYDVDSLYAFLEAKLVRPTPRPNTPPQVSKKNAKSIAEARAWKPAPLTEKFTLVEFLRPMNSEQSKKR